MSADAERGRVVGRALGLGAAAALAQAAAAVAIAWAHEEPLPVADVGLLFFATSLLGAVWALRQRLERASGVSPSASAATVPLIAVALFLAPRLFVSSASALHMLAAALLVAPLVERGWTRLVAPDDEEAQALRAALAAAPLAGLALAVDALPVLAAGLVAAGALAALIALRARTVEREEARWVAFVEGIRIGPEGVVRPAPPEALDPGLRALDEALRRRTDEITRDAEADAAAREQIAEARALRTRFMAVMSHELRSPLNSIVGFSLVLERGLDGPLSEGQRESVQMIHRSADELIMLLTDVLDLARLEAGRLTLRRAWIPSVEILTESVARGRALVEGRDVAIEAELQPGLPPVHADARRIVQAVVALFRNAAASLSRTTIRLRARIAQGPPGPARHLRVEIHHAIGAIPAAEVSRIFEAFQEISEPTGRRLGGLGMALTLSRGLVRLHGGEVWAEPSPGEGTVLCLAIPLDDGDDGT